MSSEDTLAAPSGAEQLKTLIHDIRQEYDQIQRELKEIDVLIRQSTAEVDKLVQRNTQIANRVRQMETTIDTYPRSDIKEIYAAAHEAQMRLFMMRGQVEQLQNRQQSLEQQGQRALQFIARGRSNKEIAHDLGISRQTVKNHMTSILRKLAVNDRTQAAIYALRRGWIRLQDIG